MTRAALLASLLAFVVCRHAAAIDERNWSSVWGAIEYRELGDTAVGTDGTIYSVGTTRTAFDNQPLLGTEGGVLSAHDAAGNRLWTRIFGPSGSYASAHGVAVDASGHVYVTGQTWDTMDGQPKIGNGDLYVKVFDAGGSSVWTRVFGSSTIDEGNGIALDSTFNIYVTGYTTASFGGTTTYVGKKDLCLVKLTPDGSTAWARIWGSTEDDYGHGVAVGGTNIYVVGYSYGSVDGQNFAGTTDLVLSKFASDGTKLWTRMWGDGGTQKGHDVAVDAAGNAYVTGYGGDFNGVLGVGGADAFLVKVNPSGEASWTDAWGSTGDDLCFGIALGWDGRLYTTGHAAYQRTFDGQGGYDGGAFLSCHDVNGSRQWSHRWGGGDTEGWDVAPAATNVLYVGGWTWAGIDGQPGGGADNHLFVSRWGPYGPPRITAGPDVWAAGTTNATVSWQLNRDANGWVDYSRYATHWEQTTTDPIYTTQHDVPLVGLKPRTSYRYRVRSVAQDGQAVTSSVHSFTTPGDTALGTVAHTVLRDGGFPMQIVAESSGDIDRVELRIDGQIAGMWYGDGAEWGFDDDSPAMTVGDHDLMITGYRPDGGIGSMSFGSWGFSNTGLPTRCEIEDPWRGYVFYTDGAVVPSTNILLRVLAAKRVTTVVEGGAGGWPFGDESGRIRMDWGSVSNVRFYVDGTLVHTSTTPVPNLYGADLYHEFHYDIGGLRAGVHRFHAAFTPPPGFCLSADSRSFRIEQRTSELVAWREVGFNSVSNCLVVDLKVHNRGSGAATIGQIADSATGFQIGRVTTGGFGTSTNNAFAWGTRQSRMTVVSDPPHRLSAGGTITVRYHAVPILFRGGDYYQLGGSGLVQGRDTAGAILNLDVNAIETTVGRSWEAPVPIADAVTLCKRNADYLLVSSPVNLSGVYGEADSGKILSTMAELASYRNGVLGYFSAASVVRTAYRSGDPIDLGYTFAEWGRSDQIWVGDRSENRLRAYTHVKEVLDADIPVPVVADVRSGDGLAVGQLLIEDIAGAPHPRQEIAVAYGDGHGAAAGDIAIYKYKHDPTNGIVTSFTIADTGYGTGGAVLAGRFVRGRSNDVLAVFAPDGVMGFYSCYDSGGIAYPSDPTGFDSDDPVAAGDLFGSDLEEIVFADVDADRLCVYAEWEGDIRVPRRYTQQAVYWQTVDPGDRIAVGDVLGGGRAEVVFADAADDRISVYVYDAAGATLELVRTIDWPFNPGDHLAVGRVGALLKDQIVVVNGTRHDGADAGVAQMFQVVGGDAPGDRYALDALIDDGGEWARQLHSDWASEGFLLLVGETEIVPAFRSSWEIYYDARYHTHEVDFHDVNYANTHDALTKPELAIGRIPGNSVDMITAGMRTSIDLATGAATLDTSLGLTISGEVDSHRFRPIRRDIAERLRGMGFSLVDSINSLDATGTLTFAANRDVFFLAGHGNWNVCCGIGATNVRDIFSPGTGRPLVYAASCLTGLYPTGAGFAEQFLQNGASVYIGATATTYGDIDISFTRAFFNRLDDYPTIGQALKHAKRNRAATEAGGYPSERRWNRYHCAAYHCFGDPKVGFDWGGGVTGLGERGLEAANPTDFVGPLSTLSVTIPAYQVVRTNGVDLISIAGEGSVTVGGMPIVPQYAVTVAFPSGCVVQAVDLNKRGGESQVSGLNPPIASVESNSIAPHGGMGLQDVDVWPDRVFDWSVDEDGDGSVLVVTMYPFYHNTNTSASLFYSNYVFDISYAFSSVRIAGLTTDSHAYSNGQAMTASVYLHATNLVPMNVVLHPRAVCQADESVTPLPVRELRGMSGWVGCRLAWAVEVPRSGEYLLEVAAVGENEVVLDRASTRFEVGGGYAVLRDASIKPLGFALNDNVDLGITLDNTGAIEIDGFVHILVQDGAGTTVAHFQRGFASLIPGGSVPFQTTWTGATLLPRNCRIIFYAVYGGRTTSLQTLADGSADPLFVESISANPSACIVTWPSMAGCRYSVWCSSNLLDGFAQATSGIPASPPYNSYTNTQTSIPMFYRVNEER